MRTIKRTRTVYRCGICRTDHDRKRDAEACEAGGIEEKKFRVGDRVVARGKRTCPNGHAYVCAGRVRRIVGPEPYEAEVHGKGYGLWRSPGHLFMYELLARCSTCGNTAPVRYPAFSLRKAPVRATAR
ncbi:MAG TPA: hypothetical protein VL426_03340 [Candidatus Binatia bacterium]|jgi:hypothetical protein|nr:hypothetical protein [Candidatus Binatia bacterium]